ncbi:NAD(+)/NADH kinase [Actinoplanes sp. GCM10030250]|uniref:NAD(+)/NADH kinase n=1 Tax=Actinoplanes sp. GCM10030250 TaxID=3273376 RepID=UPI00361484D4
MGMVKVVGLVLHPRRDCGSAVDAIVNWAAERGVTVLGLPDEITRIACSAVPVPVEEMVERAGLLVSLGGDGTMLRTMRLVEGRKTPVLGVNVGRLGFLAEVDLPDLGESLSAIDDHRYTVEPRTAVRTTLPDGRQVTAFNDIALVRVPGHGLAAVGIRVEGSNFVNYAADAVIVATPTGSTAYSFSAGGPIVSPNVRGLIVSAAAAHSSFNRSLVLDTSERVALEVLPTSGRLAIEVDGIIEGYAEPGACLDVEPLPDAAQVIRFGRTSFYERARRKLRVEGSAQAGNANAADAIVVDSFEHQRYEVVLGGEVAGMLHYRRHADRIELLHTEVDQAFSGRGLAGRLAAAALTDARSRSTPVVATCPFVAGYLERHPENES